jgi:hypothetical protein
VKRTIGYLTSIIVSAFMLISECKVYDIAPGSGGNNTGSQVCAIKCDDDTAYVVDCDSDIMEGPGIIVLEN